jgi:hypothetical protein
MTLVTLKKLFLVELSLFKPIYERCPPKLTKNRRTKEITWIYKYKPTSKYNLKLYCRQLINMHLIWYFSLFKKCFNVLLKVLSRQNVFFFHD